MSGEKERKPILEALLSRMDGLDILAEIAGEKKTGEKREEKEPADTFGGMLQALPMLMILPAIMPLLQQTLSQTLSSSTVNVKVESSAAILPIEVSAATAIVPIEIKASDVTLNVNIAASTATVPIEIKASDVTLNVNITAATARVGINIQAQDVDVQLTETFWPLRGKDKVITSVFTYVYPEEVTVINYTVPSGKRLIVYAVLLTSSMIVYGAGIETIISRYPTAGWWPLFSDYGDDIEVYIRRGDTTLVVLELKSGEHILHKFETPLIFESGQVFRIACSTRYGLGLVKVVTYAIEVEA